MDLQTGKGFSLRLPRQKDGDHPVATAQIQTFLTFPHTGKGAQQHRVHAKAVPDIINGPIQPEKFLIIHFVKQTALPEVLPATYVTRTRPQMPDRLSIPQFPE